MNKAFCEKAKTAQDDFIFPIKTAFKEKREMKAIRPCANYLPLNGTESGRIKSMEASTSEPVKCTSHFIKLIQCVATFNSSCKNIDRPLS
jgi:hypothetical protein